jgi:acetyltransferase
VKAITETSAILNAIVRMAAPEDRESLRAMYLTFEPRPASLGLPPRVRIDEWLDRLEPSVNYLALVDGKLVGHAVLCPENGTGEVAVFVHQDYRGQGIGRQLLITLVEAGRRLGLRRVWGMTELDNVPMLALAHAVGFVPDVDPGMFHMDLQTGPPGRKA